MLRRLLLSYRQCCPETTPPAAGSSRPRQPRPCFDWRRGRRRLPPLPSRSWPPPSRYHSPLYLALLFSSLLSALIIAVCTRRTESPELLRFYGLPAAESKTTHSSRGNSSGIRVRVGSLSARWSIRHGREFALSHFHHRIRVHLHQGQQTTSRHASQSELRRDSLFPLPSPSPTSLPLWPRSTTNVTTTNHAHSLARYRRETDRRNCGLVPSFLLVFRSADAARAIKSRNVAAAAAARCTCCQEFFRFKDN